MQIIGTAGHVDHGKSTLIAALTGVHPDRLKEEQAREMTIELGFGWMTLPDGKSIGIVDVPGHRDFIENMLAGVGGIDAAMFVVAADEGVMPQTREHLAILDILQIQGGVIVLTKIDMADDPDWLDMVELDVRQAVEGTVLQDAPILRVSARNGQGLAELKQALAACLAERPERPDLGRPRLPIDRVFTMPGFGTVVTGTLTDGCLRLGDEIEIQPAGLRGRVRGLQTHKRKEELSTPGSRTAVNITGVDLEQVQRGYVLVTPGKYRPTQRMDVQFRLLPDAAGSLKHDSEVKVFLGTAESLARVRLLGSEELIPGQTGWLQLELREPLTAIRGDRYILRRPSPSETLGGGSVADPHPSQRHKRFDPQVIERLTAYQHGTPAEVLYNAALSLGAAAIKDLAERARQPLDEALQILPELLAGGQLIQMEAGPGGLKDTLFMAQPAWQTLTRQAQAELQQFHTAYPLRRGLPREQLKSRLKLQPRHFQAAVKAWAQQGTLLETGSLLALPGFTIQYTPQQAAQVNQLLARFKAAPFTPPTLKECQAELGDELCNALLENNTLLAVSAEVVFRPQDYEIMKQGVLQVFTQKDTLSVAEFRDLFNTSRRYALAFLEHLDAAGVTIRDGEARRKK